MGGEPLLNFDRFVNLGVVGDDGEVRKERRGVRAMKVSSRSRNRPVCLRYHTQWMIVPIVISKAPAS